MTTKPSRGRASWMYVIGTALLAGAAGATFAVLMAHAVGVSATISAAVSGVSLSIVVGLLIRRHGQPNQEL